MWSGPSMTRTFKGMQAYGEPPQWQQARAAAAAAARGLYAPARPPPPPPAAPPPSDGGFRRQLPCPPDVSFCITVSALPPVTWADLVHSLLESDTMRLLQGALRSTLGKSPMQFVMNVLLPARNSNYRLGEVVYGMVAYFSNVNPDKAVSIYPGARTRARARERGRAPPRPAPRARRARHGRPRARAARMGGQPPAARRAHHAPARCPPRPCARAQASTTRTPTASRSGCSCSSSHPRRATST